MDCRVLGKGDTGPIARRKVSPPKDTLTARGPMWNYAWRDPLGPSAAGAAVTVKIECIIEKGSVGFVLRPEREDRFISRAVIMEARTGNQRLCLTTECYDPDALLLTRCATALGASQYRIISIELRQTR